VLSIDKYVARKRLKEMAKTNETTGQFSTDIPFLIARATESLLWFGGVTTTAIIIKFLGYPLASIDTYLRIFHYFRAQQPIILPYSIL
jgi:hypothetical protein